MKRSYIIPSIEIDEIRYTITLLQSSTSQTISNVPIDGSITVDGQKADAKYIQGDNSWFFKE